MCLTLLTQAAAPCEMHRQHQGVAGSVQVRSQASGGMCHPDSTGCAIGGTCPSGGPAAAASVQTLVVMRGDARASLLASVFPHLSYLAPPPSPPPQA